MMMAQKKYLCFTCLEESTDPIKCTNCGENIEKLDLDAEFKPPIQGELLIKVNEIKVRIVSTTIMLVEKYNDMYFDHAFVTIDEEKGRIIVNCSDIASERIIDLFYQRFNNEKKLFSFKFEGSK